MATSSSSKTIPSSPSVGRAFKSPARKSLIKNAVFLGETELKKLTSIPGEAVSVTNVGPLYGFGGEIGNSTSFLCGHLKRFIVSNINGTRLSKVIDGAFFTERLACSYVLNQHLALEAGYESFDSRVGEVFLSYCVYEVLHKRDGKDCPDNKEGFLNRLLDMVYDYLDAFASKDRVEKAYLPSWDKRFKPTAFQRLSFTFANRGYHGSKASSKDGDRDS